MKLKNKIAEILTGLLEGEGFDLVEVKLAQYGENSRLQVFIDSDNGVTIDDCVRVSKTIGPVIDAGGLFRYGYTIEVSSPGLDRPLLTARDFRRRIGETVEIVFNDAAVRPLKGELICADDQCIELETESGSGKFNLVDIKSGRIII
jgi:ribosome maturation factor RimP